MRTECTLCRDSDNDWVIVPPEGVTIFSVPGEPVLIGPCDRETAVKEARDYLDACPGDYVLVMED